MNKLRGEIDMIDREILFLLKKRFDISKKIGDLKKCLNLPITNKDREKELVKNLSHFRYLEENEIERIWSVIFEISKEKQIIVE